MYYISIYIFGSVVIDAYLLFLVVIVLLKLVVALIKAFTL
jgi:hypothetical protein